MDDKLRIDEAIGDALDRAERGEQTTLHRHGEPVAKLVPADPTWDREEAAMAVEHLIRIRESFELGGLRFKELIHLGHRY